MKTEKEIAARLKHIVLGDDANRYPVMTGKVVSVDEGSMDCEVQLTGDNAGNGVIASTNGVTLNVSLENTGGVYLIPANGADCLVAEVDGKGKWELLKASAYTKVAGVIGSQT